MIIGLCPKAQSDKNEILDILRTKVNTISLLWFKSDLNAMHLELFKLLAPENCSGLFISEFLTFPGFNDSLE